MIRTVLARVAQAVVARRDSYIRALRPSEPADLAALFEDWLVAMSSSLDSETIRTYRVTYVAKHWVPFFGTLERCTDPAALADYGRARLGLVLKKTVGKELSALHGFHIWLAEQGKIAEAPAIPKLPRKATGVRAGKQRAKAPEHSETQIRAAIASMPERSAHGIIVRPRFVVAYETGLRPATLDALTYGMLEDNGTTLALSAEGDKARFGRKVPLSELAIVTFAELAGPSPDPAALIFGKHDYRPFLRDAARAVGLKSLSPYDFRHSMVTHSLEHGASLPGVAWLVGHLQLTTTNRYAHPGRRAAEGALAARGAVAPAPTTVDAPSVATRADEPRRAS